MKLKDFIELLDDDYNLNICYEDKKSKAGIKSIFVARKSSTVWTSPKFIFRDLDIIRVKIIYGGNADIMLVVEEV